MRTPIAAGNWKMNNGPSQAASFAGSLRNALNGLSGVECVVFPPFISISSVHDILRDSTLQLGAQNIADHVSGAYTGEVAANMVAELCTWTIIGHSERRGYYGETDAVVNAKLHLALDNNLTPVVCVGELIEQRQAGQTAAVVEAQVRGSLGGISAEQIGRVVVAYEPVWAIGTGLAATRQDAEEVTIQIRTLMSELYGAQVADNLRILYGGSVTGANVGEFMASPEIDGALVGGASLKPDFINIAQAIAEARKA
jgi:triosephosphate isomerase (TIM)